RVAADDALCQPPLRVAMRTDHRHAGGPGVALVADPGRPLLIGDCDLAAPQPCNRHGNFTTTPAVNSACQAMLAWITTRQPPCTQANARPSTSTKVAKIRPSNRTPTWRDGKSLAPPPPPSVNRISLSASAA